MVAVGSRHHEPAIATRSSARHARPLNSAHAADWADARLGRFRKDPAGIPGSPAGEPGVALSGPAPAGAPRLDQGAVGRVGTGPPGAVLSIDGNWAQAT